ncbi:protein-tyrosine phosphatase [Streptacidiphilus sp. MAP12-20]|uniref:tyrosine-protein phosphatase n=1 Tax=Streptacidiphilus sp. MAP12-20 TaxID=3156299 RepID=UPI003517F0B6
MSISGAERLIPVPGVLNFRDAGGFPTASGGRVAEALLYRSASLHQLTDEGSRHLAELGLRTVIDLRSQIEREVWPDRELDANVQVLHLPTFPPRVPEQQARDERDAEAGAESLDGLYAYMAATAGPAIAASTRALARPGALPALVHCAVGKDRTGVTVATIQSALGVSDADVVADYHLSNSALGLDKGPVYYVDEHGEERRSSPIHPALLTGFLTRIRATYGDATGYLLAHGVTQTDLTTLRATLL